MPIKKKYSQAARVQGILKTLGTRQGITVGELAEEFGVTKKTTPYCDSEREGRDQGVGTEFWIKR